MKFAEWSQTCMEQSIFVMFSDHLQHIVFAFKQDFQNIKNAPPQDITGQIQDFKQNFSNTNKRDLKQQDWGPWLMLHIALVLAESKAVLAC